MNRFRRGLLKEGISEDHDLCKWSQSGCGRFESQELNSV